MKKRIGGIICSVLSLLMNLFIVCAEPVALPMSWDWGHETIFWYYTEDSNIFAATVCAMVAIAQLISIFTGRAIPHWLKRLKFVATSCLALTMLTVVFVLAPMYGPGGYYVTMFTSSMLYHHFLNPVIAMVSFILLERTPRLEKSDIKWALLPTLIYGSIMVCLNIAHIMDGPYPFLKVYEQSVLTSVMWVAVIFGADYFYSWLLWKLGGNGRRKIKA